MNDMIGRYAQLSLAAERLGRAGRQVPLSIVREIQQIEATALTRLSPYQIQAAMQHVQHAKNAILQKETSSLQASAVEGHHRAKEQISRSLTKNWLNQPNGLTEKQFVAVRDGKKVKFSAPKRLTPEELDRLSIEQTRSLDPKGRGYKFKEWEERLDRLADTSPERFDEEAKKYRGDPEKLREAAQRWRVERIDVGLQRRREEKSGPPKDVEVDGDSYRRKALVVNAFAKSFNPNDKQHRRLFDPDDGIKRIISEGEGATEGSAKRSADIARAWEETEARAEETSNEQSE